ncbi:putative outer membrane protein [Escherichia coli]|nr:putative outer membrane protein [Escherichia coli]SQZ60256.1 putative outer membrane protein [Escherichia coli]SRY94862.1 putative outer membrane protein [Escherichia coli]
MKSKVLALLIPALLAAGAAHAAEVYNKDGNKLDLYGKVDGLHYFSDNSAKDGDQSYARLGFKGETQINDQLTGYGQWEYNIQANNTESSKNQSWTRLAFAGLKFADWICPYISRHLLSLNPLLACCRRYSRGER